MSLGVALSLFIVGCGTPERYAYLQNVELAKHYTVQHDRLIVVEPGDRLQVAVQSAYPELVAPFNGHGFPSTPAIGGASALPQVNNTVTSQYEEQALRMYGYTVNDMGEITFPVIGQIKVGGLTLEKVKKKLEEAILATKYVPDPRVEVMFSNFHIYLLGASKAEGSGVGNINYGVGGYNTSFTPINTIGGGVLRISDKQQVSILEALAYIGDLPMNANVEKVNVIRRKDGQFVTYRLNMKSTDIYNSPAFYLKQNDIIYVEPLYRRSDNEGLERILQISSFAFSSLTSIMALVALFKR